MTKFLVKISLIEFLVMTEKNIFVYQLYLYVFQILVFSEVSFYIWCVQLHVHMPAHPPAHPPLV